MIKHPLNTLIFCVLFLNSLSTIAQESAVKLNHKISSNRNVDFSVEKTDPGTYTLVVNFSNLTNSYGANQQIITVKDYAANAFSLLPVNKDQNIGFSYNYSYIRGKLNPKFDKSFLYLLPYKVGTKVRAVESVFVNSIYFGSTTPEDWKSYHFYTEQPDSITAVRKGLVVNVKDLYNTDETADLAFSSKVNEITIEHQDGTLAYYKGFKKGIKVKVGQVVFPGTVLGYNTKSNNNTYYYVALLMSYLKDKGTDDTNTKTLKESKSRYGFITPHFFTAESPDLILESQKYYTVSSTPAIIQKELTKKEIKNLGQ